MIEGLVKKPTYNTMRAFAILYNNPEEYRTETGLKIRTSPVKNRWRYALEANPEYFHILPGTRNNSNKYQLTPIGRDYVKHLLQPLQLKTELPPCV